jgi:hypothetical protein
VGSDRRLRQRTVYALPPRIEVDDNCYPLRILCSTLQPMTESEWPLSLARGPALGTVLYFTNDFNLAGQSLWRLCGEQTDKENLRS